MKEFFYYFSNKTLFKLSLCQNIGFTSMHTLLVCMIYFLLISPPKLLY